MNSLGHHRAEELVEERLFDEHKFSIQGQSLNRMVEQFSTSAQALFEVPKLSCRGRVSGRGGGAVVDAPEQMIDFPSVLATQVVKYVF